MKGSSLCLAQLRARLESDNAIAWIGTVLEPRKGSRKVAEIFDLDDLRIEPALHNVVRHCPAGGDETSPLQVVAVGMHGIQSDLMQ